MRGILKAFNDVELQMSAGKAFQRLDATDQNARPPSVRRVFALDVTTKMDLSDLREYIDLSDLREYISSIMSYSR